MKSLIPDLALKAESVIGESPQWHEAGQRLYWVDIQRGRVQRFDPATGTNEVFEIPDMVTSLNFRKGGGLILTLRREFAFYDCHSRQLQKLGSPEPDLPGNRFNDAQCDRQGRLWAGTMGADTWESPSGNLYRFDATQKPVLVRSQVVCSNGSGWSPDNRVFYHTESFRYTVFAYDFDPVAGRIDNRRPFIELDPEGGEFPDGLTVDAEGFVWSAHVGKGRLVRYDPGGGAEREIQLPVSRGTSCVFGGADWKTLFITTARETLKESDLAREPLAGSLFACHPGPAGLPPGEFAE